MSVLRVCPRCNALAMVENKELGWLICSECGHVEKTEGGKDG